MPRRLVSDEAIEVTRAWFETWNRGDLDAFIDLYAGDAEMTPDPSWVEAGTFKGQLAIRRFFEGLKESWDGEDRAVLRDLFKAGTNVVARMDWQVRGRTSGIDTHLDITNVNTVENGKIVRQRHYFDHGEALKAVGLEE
jgi:ketosteroid isomerase-like protein